MSRSLEQLLQQREQFLAFVRREVGEAAAEDILQEAYVKGTQAIGTLRDAARARAWFYRILRNAITDHYRRNASSRAALEELANEPMEEIAPRRICRCALTALPALKPEYEAILRAVDLGGARVEAVAAELQITANNASVRLFRARRALQESLQALCTDCCTGDSIRGCMDCYCAD